jgi:hypothetical protein
MRPISKLIAIAVVLGALAIGGCAEGEGEAKPPVCDSFAAVQLTIDQIQNANVAENGLSQLKTDLQKLKTELEKLYADAAAAFATQVQAVKAAADTLAASITTARADPNAANLAAVRTALAGVPASLQTLGDAMKGTC